MKIRNLLGGMLLAAGTAATPQLAAAESNINIGYLRCTVSAGMGVLVTSSKGLECEYTALGGGFRERYVGTIRKFGFDLGPTNQGVLIWDVIAPAGGPVAGALQGDYIGGAASATVGVGLGANALVAMLGPSNGRSITLQPLSTQEQTGLNFAAGIASMSLQPEAAPVYIPPVPRYHSHRPHRYHQNWR